MRTRKCDWLDTSTGKVWYGIQVRFNNDWNYVSDGDKPCLYGTPEERDEKRKELRTCRVFKEVK